MLLPIMTMSILVLAWPARLGGSTVTELNVPNSAPPEVGPKSLKDRKLNARSFAVTSQPSGQLANCPSSCHRRSLLSSIKKCSLPDASTVPFRLDDAAHILQKICAGF